MLQSSFRLSFNGSINRFCYHHRNLVLLYWLWDVEFLAADDSVSSDNSDDRNFKVVDFIIASRKTVRFKISNQRSESKNETSRLQLQLSLYHKNILQNFLRDIKFSWQRRKKRILRVFWWFDEPSIKNTLLSAIKFLILSYLVLRNQERILWKAKSNYHHNMPGWLRAQIKLPLESNFQFIKSYSPFFMAKWKKISSLKA